PERGFEWSSQADEQRIWKNHDIRQRLRAHPFEQLVKFFALASVLTAQHRDSQLTQMPRADGNGAACSGLQGRVGVPETVHPRRREPQRRKMLLEINTDAAEKYFFAADVRLVRQRRRIERDENHVVSLGHQLRR